MHPHMISNSPTANSTTASSIAANSTTSHATASKAHTGSKRPRRPAPQRALRKWGLAAAVAGLLALFFHSLPEPAPSYQGDFVVGPVRVFQQGAFSKQPLYVTVDDGVISAISADKPDVDMPFVSAAGGTLLPGLTDAHVHTYGNALEQQLRAGVTTVLDMFMAPELLQTQLQAQQQPSTIAREASLYSAGVLATSPKGHGTEYSIQIPTIIGPEQADAFVRERKAQGSAYLKIVYQSKKAPYQRMTSIDQATLHALVQAAHQQGLKAVVHIADQVSAQDAVAAGADGLVHSFFDSPINAELLRALVDRQVFVIPTMAVYDANLGGTLNQRFSALVESARPLTRREQQGLASLQLPRLLPPHLLQTLYANVRAMHDAGVVLLAGTDAPNGGTLHGVSLQAELLALREAGLSSEQALSAASSLPLRQFGITDRGEIAVGQKADLILLAPGDVWQQLTKPLRIWHHGLPVNVQQSHNPALSAGVLLDFSEQAPGDINTDAASAGMLAGSVKTRQGFASLQTDARFGGKSTLHAKITTASDIAMGVQDTSVGVQSSGDNKQVGVHGSVAASDTSVGVHSSQSSGDVIAVGVHGSGESSGDNKQVGVHGSQPNPALQLRAELDAKSANPWAGFSWVPFEQFDRAADLSQASQLQFRIKGDAAVYRLLVISGDQMQPVSIDIPVTAQWQTLTLDLAAQKGVDISAIKVILWSAPAQAGEYQWWLDDIALLP